MRERFTYYALYPRDRSRPVGLLAEGRLHPTQDLRVVGWDYVEETWTESGAALNAITIDPDYEDRFQIVDRATAEQIARENLGAELPSEEELDRIGERAAQERRRGRTQA